MKKQTGKISLPETRAPGTLPEPVRKDISLEELSLLCQDDAWMERFIQDTQENHMHKAPFHMKEEVQNRRQQQTFASGIHFLSPRMQLLRYSLQVSAVAAGAIILLFTWPPAVGTSGASGRPYSICTQQQAGTARPSPYKEERPNLEQKRKIFDFSDSINPFSIEFFNREVTPND